MCEPNSFFFLFRPATNRLDCISAVHLNSSSLKKWHHFTPFRQKYAHLLPSNGKLISYLDVGQNPWPLNHSISDHLNSRCKNQRFWCWTCGEFGITSTILNHPFLRIPGYPSEHIFPEIQAAWSAWSPTRNRQSAKASSARAAASKAIPRLEATTARACQVMARLTWDQKWKDCWMNYTEKTDKMHRNVQKVWWSNHNFRKWKLEFSLGEQGKAAFS